MEGSPSAARADFDKFEISMKKPFLVIVLLNSLNLHGQEIVHRFQPVSITASRLQSSLAAETRELDILTSEDIANIPVGSVPELIRFIGNADIQQRGNDGVQTDFSLRGSGFEQVLVLLNGVRLNDPQTGHHNADIPISMSDVRRIEILHGHASSMYGPEGYGGVINIITKKPDASRSSVRIGGGSFGMFGASLSQSLKFRQFSTEWTIEHRQSDGYRPVTDYNISSVSNTTRWGIKHHEISLTAGAAFKHFGANDFYGNYPSREKTRAILGILNYSCHPHRYLKWDTRFHIRRHTDDFILDIENPDDNQNHHISNAIGAESTLRFHLTQNLMMAWGSELIRETLESTHLGNRKRHRLGLYGELLTPVLKRGVINSGVRFDRFTNHKLQISPSVNLGYKIGEGFRWRGAAGRIFRTPTFTELYYQSKAIMGDPDLHPESGWNVETGLDYAIKHIQLSATFFQRQEQDRIDWMAEYTGSPWQCVNIGKLKTNGISISVSHIPADAVSWKLNYTILKRHPSDTEGQFKYLMGMRQHFQGLFIYHGPWNLVQTLHISWKERQKNTNYWLISAKWSRKFSRGRVFAEVRNLLNTDYREIGDIPMPGRSVRGGLEMTWNY